MIEVEVQELGSMDLEEVTRLQISAFSEILHKSKVEFLHTADYFRWKSKTPFGNTLVASVRDKGRLVSMNAMFPLRVWGSGVKTRAWQSSDTATLPETRGRGYFMLCLNALKKKLNQDEIFFGFPNSNSISGFKKIGWKEKGCLQTFAHVFPTLNTNKKKSAFESINEIATFTPSQNDFFLKIANGGSFHLDRTAEFMNWRYATHPHHKYYLYQSESLNGGQNGSLVLRELRIHGVRVLIIMDCSALDESVEKNLIKFATVKAHSLKIPVVFMINNFSKISFSLSLKYIRLPTWALPKRQVLMGCGTSTQSQLIFDHDWRVQIGDWDGF